MRPPYEPSDLSPRGVTLTLAGLFGGLLLVMALVALFVAGPHAPAGHVPALGSVQAPPPRLLADPAAERRRIEAAQQRRLGQGARIPIDQAMTIVARRGWGEKEPAPDAQATARGHAVREAVR